MTTAARKIDLYVYVMMGTYESSAHHVSILFSASLLVSVWQCILDTFYRSYWIMLPLRKEKRIESKTECMYIPAAGELQQLAISAGMSSDDILNTYSRRIG